MTSGSEQTASCPPVVADFAEQAVDYVRRALGLTLEYDSDTLPLLDHYLRELDDDRDETVALVASTAGAYFGEVVRRRLGGAWSAESDDPGTWRLVLPGGLSFLPTRMALAAILRDDSGEANADFQTPPKMWPHVEAALERMAQVSEETYYTLCCKLDTLEHLQAVLLAIAAEAARKRSEADPGHN